jgi:sialate O-acetylesterase
MLIMSRLCWMLGFVATLLSSNTAQADVKLPQLFSDHMVVQRDMAVPVWGWAAPGEGVSVQLAGQEMKTAADDQGKWMVKLTALSAGGPHELVVTGNNTLKITDVYAGEVWICSGQSNMQWTVSQSANPVEEATAAKFPQLRMFSVERTATDQAQQDCRGSWQVCSPQTTGNFSAVGYYFGRYLHQKLEVPLGMINSSWGGTVCEAWTSHAALAADPPFEAILGRAAVAEARHQEGPNFASRLYKGMIMPLVPYAIRGAIWYQGESNVPRAAQYRRLFPTMIQDWRRTWGQGDFAFLFVQLAPFRYSGQDMKNCAELWEAQAKTLELPNTGMAVTVDIGDVRDIHPKNKQDVGKRLALWALAKTYGKEVCPSGPLYKSMQIEGDAIRLTFDYTGSGLASRDGQPLTDFTIAGEDQQFLPATATIDGNQVVVRSAAVAKPVAVRFAWYDAAQPNLANREGLPASPFRTDDWPPVTAGRE